MCNVQSGVDKTDCMQQFSLVILGILHKVVKLLGKNGGKSLGVWAFLRRMISS